MKEAVDVAYKTGDTIGGVFEVVAHGLPPGLGSHITWDTRLDGRLAQAIVSIQAVKGVEIGFAPGWSVGFEYNHLFMGTRNVTTTLTPIVFVGAIGFRNERIREDVDMGTVRVNYTFGGPVVAKY